MSAPTSIRPSSADALVHTHQPFDLRLKNADMRIDIRTLIFDVRTKNRLLFCLRKQQEICFYLVIPPTPFKDCQVYKESSGVIKWIKILTCCNSIREALVWLAPLDITLHPNGVQQVLSKASVAAQWSRLRCIDHSCSTYIFQANSTPCATGVSGKRRTVTNTMEDFTDEGTHIHVCQ